jgi:hypothetical protein
MFFSGAIQREMDRTQRVRDHGFLRKDKEDGTAQVLDFEWDQPGKRWTYSVPEKFRNTHVKALDGH